MSRDAKLKAVERVHRAAPLDHEPELSVADVLVTPRAVHRMHAANRRDRREAIESRQRKAAEAERRAREKVEREAAEAKAQGDYEAAVALALCVPGSVWGDASGRMLAVDEVTVGDPLGREVIGHLGTVTETTTTFDTPYSTTLASWQAVWHDKAERWGTT